jgi:damage-control phosphatase, subfamily I
MKTSLDCIPGFIRQALEAARMVTRNPVVHEQIVRDVLGTVSKMDLAEPPPVINDATRVDANAAGIHELCEVIDNGSDAPGTRLDDCSEEFRRRFREADLIIAKGQGNYETLSDESANVFFLLKVKCAVIASHIGMPEGTHVLRRSHLAPTGAGGNGYARI